MKQDNEYNDLDVLANKYGTDKCKEKHYYTKWYNKYFSPIKDDVINILEIGIRKGCSHLMWRDYFKNGNIFGIDIKDQNSYDKKLKGVKCFLGDASDNFFLNKVCSSVKGGFDIIVDDASHKCAHQIKTFDFLFPKLNKGGIYVVEDLQTSYIPKYSKGCNAINYFKDLVDSVNFKGKIIYKNDFNEIPPEIKSTATVEELLIESIHFYTGICFIFKR